MNQQLLRIRDIRPDLRSWSVKVLVESKTSPRQSMNSPKRYQRLTLLDEMGDRILATIFDLDINQFERTLSLLDTYIISNARVVLANPDYETYGNTYQWIISHRTVITKELVNLIPASIVVQNFAPFADLQPAERRITVDILAIVIRKFEQRTIGSGPKSLIIHEFAVLTHERRPMMLALWNNVATSEAEFIMAAADPMLIISATKLNVSDHYGVSLGSTPSTTLVVDPPIPEAQRLKIWRANNERAITEALLQVQEIIKRQQLSVQVSARLLTISEVVRAGNGDRFHLKVKAQVTNTDQKFFYIACEKCHTSFAAECDWPLDCHRCNMRTLAKPREMVIVSMFDHTGSLEVTVFGECAVKITQMNAMMAMRMHDAGIAPPVEEMNLAIANTTFFVKLKKYQRMKHDGTHTQYTALSLAKADEFGNSPAITPTPNLDDIDHDIPPPQAAKAKKRLFSPDIDSEAGSSSSQKKMKTKVGDDSAEENLHDPEQPSE